MPRQRRKIDASRVLGLQHVPIAVARKVLEALPDLGCDYDFCGLRYDLDCARTEILDDTICIVDLPLKDGGRL